ncbi:MAG: hypothetical protein JNK74_09130 [Candidatus Hydrogenedentes bacterium]|nr:hypothetical protein [Candidatus Hydrogenedentota bacterium]
MLEDTREETRMTLRDIALLVGLAILAFGPSLASNVLTDDLILIRNARHISWSFPELATSFRLEHPDYTAGWLPGPFNHFSLQYFRPVIMASLKLDSALWNDWPPGFHVTNILVFIAMVLLVVRWARDFGLNRSDRMLLGMLFILYTPNQMAVNVIASRTELIADVFLLASVIWLGCFYANRKLLFFVGAFIAGLLALGSKENAVMLPLLHGVAALFLYRPSGDESGGLKVRLLALLPFVLMVPAYFALRSAMLGGFPPPLKGFYFHHPLDPGFTQFLISKLIHAALTLVYQFPILLPPVLIQYSVPTAIATGLIAIVTLVAVYRETRPPFRFFMLFWIGVCIAPTLPMGLNPIYYFLCSPVMAVFYVFMYRKYRAATVSWQPKLAKVLLVSALSFGLLNAIGGAVNAHVIGEPSRVTARETAEILASKPEVRSVFFVDLPPAGFDLVPAIRFKYEEHADKDFYLLSIRENLFDPAACDITQVDAYAFELRPKGGALLKIGVEEGFIGYPLERFAPGMKAIHPDYEMEVIEAEAEADGAPDFLTRIKHHYRIPPASQNGIAVLRYRFKTPLAANDRLFLQLTRDGVKEIPFLNEADFSTQGGSPIQVSNPS